MCPRSQTSGLISEEWTRTRSSSDTEATSPNVRSRASARSAMAWLTAGLPSATEVERVIDAILSSVDPIAQIERPVPLEHPGQLQLAEGGQLGAAGDGGGGAPADQLGCQRQEQLVHQVLAQERS